MSWWSKVKEATKKVATAVKNVVTATAKVITTARQIASPSLPTIITTASNILTSSRNTSTSSKNIQTTTSRPTAEDEIIKIREETSNIKESVEAVVELKWWEILIKDALGLDISIRERMKAFLGATGLDTTLNTLTKLMFGKNLKGEPEEFGSANDYLEIIFAAAAFIPQARVGATGIKLAISKISTKEAAILAAKFGERATASKLIDVVKLHPETSARFLSKFPVKVREAVVFGLGKTGYGKEVIYALGQTGYYKYTAPIWKKATSILFKVGMGVMVVTLPIFALTEIPNMFNMLQFARKQRLEAEGKWPSDIAFKLNDFENLMKSYTFDIDRAIKAGEMPMASDLITKIEGVFEEYKNYREEKKEEMLPEDYDLTELAIEFYETYISDRKSKIVAVPIETDEEKWARLRREAEERRNQEILDDEIRWKRIQTETKTRRDEARADEKDYWDKLISEAEIRRKERKDDDAIYWDRIQKEAEVATEEKRIAAEEYWDKIAAEQKIKRDEERIYWDLILAGPKKAIITITSEPSNAEVYIDGEFKWTTTPYTILLPLGDHIIRVQKDGYFPEEGVIEVEEGDVAEIPFILDLIPEDQKPVETYIPQKPYFEEYRPDEPYIPSIIETPKAEIPSLEYARLFPDVFGLPGIEPLAPPAEKEILINIETTDVKPWKGRIYSIAFLDLSISGSEPVVLVNDNEEELITDFLTIFNQGNYKKLVGFKLAFDHRYIFAKMMLYRIQSKKFKEIDLRDVKQIMDQVKEEFVYFPDKKGSLDDWGKMLLGKGKYGAQELMLRKYLAGDFEYVKAFQLRQLELTNGLYQLSRLVSSEALISPIPTPEILPMSLMETSTHESSNPAGQKECPNCLAFNPLDASKCLVCSTEFKGGA